MIFGPSPHFPLHSYLAALPPTDNQLNGQHGPTSGADGAPIPSNNAVGEKGLANVAEREAGALCQCPCKLLADKTSLDGPKVGELLDGAEVGEVGLAETETHILEDRKCNESEHNV